MLNVSWYQPCNLFHFFKINRLFSCDRSLKPIFFYTFTIHILTPGTMTVYTLAEMDSDLINFFENTLPFDDPYYSFFQLQLIYGLRFNECKSSNTWSFPDSTHCIIPLSKGQSTRTIEAAQQDIEVIQYFITFNNYFKFANETTASNILKREYEHRLYLETGKALTTHFFRHYRIKYLYHSGQTVQQIATWIGEVNLNNINGYINSVIQYP